MDTLAVPAATTQRASPPNTPRGRPLPGIAVTFLFVHWVRPFHTPGPPSAPKQASCYNFDLASATQIDMIFLVVLALPVQRNLQMFFVHLGVVRPASIASVIFNSDVARPNQVDVSRFS